jgi:hypothetical protein
MSSTPDEQANYYTTKSSSEIFYLSHKVVVFHVNKSNSPILRDTVCFISKKNKVLSHAVCN